MVGRPRHSRVGRVCRLAHIRSISKYKDMEPDGRVILELPFSYIRDWTGANLKGCPRERVKPTNRVDIALLNAQGRPIHAIEVKQKWHSKTSFEDVEKIRDLLLTFGPAKDGTLKSVYFSVYRQGCNRPCLHERLDHTEEEIGRLLNRDDVGHRFHRHICGPVTRDKDRKEWEYGSHIIELFRRNRRAV